MSAAGRPASARSSWRRGTPSPTSGWRSMRALGADQGRAPLALPPPHRARAHGGGAGAGSGLVPAYTLAGSGVRGGAGTLRRRPREVGVAVPKGLTLDPRWTGARVGLARTLIKRGRRDEARRELEAVVAEREPRNLADWTLKDSREARELLAVAGRRGDTAAAPATPRAARRATHRAAAPGAAGLANHLARGGGGRAARPLPRAHRLHALAPHQGRDHRTRRRASLRARRHARAPWARLSRAGASSARSSPWASIARRRASSSASAPISSSATTDACRIASTISSRSRAWDGRPPTWWSRWASASRASAWTSTCTGSRTAGASSARGLPRRARRALRRACRVATGSATTISSWPSARTSASRSRRAAPSARWPTVCPRVGVTRSR